MKYLLIAVLALVAVSTVHADHNKPPILPGILDPSKVLADLYADGELTYGFDAATSAYPGFRQQAANVASRYKANTGIIFREANPGEVVDIWNTGPADSAFISTCGQGAAACVNWYYHPATVYYRLSLGFNTFNGWESTLAHEWGHILGEHEQYDDKAFACYPRGAQFFTQMQCGRPAEGREPRPFDVATIWNVTVPDRPAVVGFSADANWATVSWNSCRADGGLAHFGKACNQENATRTAFGHSFCDGCPIEWVGVTCGASFNYCYTPFSHGTRSFDRFWAGCLYLRVENLATWAVPQISAPDYWWKAGCW